MRVSVRYPVRMASIGAGMKYSLTDKLVLRTEFRDYITAFPTNLIAPAPGAKFGSLLQDVVPMVLLLASPLSSWTTGQIISVNGGYAMP